MDKGLAQGIQTHINLAILKALLQILIDRFIRHFAQQSQVRDSDLPPFRRIERCLPDVGFPSAGRRPTAA